MATYIVHCTQSPLAFWTKGALQKVRCAEIHRHLAWLRPNMTMALSPLFCLLLLLFAFFLCFCPGVEQERSETATWIQKLLKKSVGTSRKL
jgi:hypothetical protein